MRKAHKVHKELLVLLDTVECKVPKALQELKVHKGLKVLLVHPVILAYKVHKV